VEETLKIFEKKEKKRKKFSEEKTRNLKRDDDSLRIAKFGFYRYCMCL